MNKPSRAIRSHGKKANKSTRKVRMWSRIVKRLEKEVDDERN